MARLRRTALRPLPQGERKIPVQLGRNLLYGGGGGAGVTEPIVHCIWFCTP